MRFKEFEQWCYDRSIEGYLTDELAIDCFLLIKDIYERPFWMRRRVWKIIEHEIIENIVIPINSERQFNRLREEKRVSKLWRNCEDR